MVYSIFLVPQNVGPTWKRGKWEHMHGTTTSSVQGVFEARGMEASAGEKYLVQLRYSDETLFVEPIPKHILSNVHEAAREELKELKRKKRKTNEDKERIALLGDQIKMALKDMERRQTEDAIAGLKAGMDVLFFFSLLTNA